MAWLLAIDFEDIFKIAVILIFVFGGLISQLLRGLFKSAAKGPQRPRPAVPPRPQGAPGMGEKGGKPAGAGAQAPAGMSGRDRAFLERLERQRGGSPPSEVEVIEPPRSPRRPVSRESAPVPAEVVAPEPPLVPISTSEFTTRAAHLGEEVGLADEKLEAHLHATFEEAIGPAKHARRDTNERAMAIRRVLSNPESLRDAFVLQEILRPPTDRW